MNSLPRFTTVLVLGSAPFALLDSYGLEPDPFGSGLLVVLVGVVFGFGVWFGAAGLDCQAHPAYPPSEFVSVTCASRHT